MPRVITNLAAAIRMFGQNKLDLSGDPIYFWTSVRASLTDQNSKRELERTILLHAGPQMGENGRELTERAVLAKFKPLMDYFESAVQNRYWFDRPDANMREWDRVVETLALDIPSPTVRMDTASLTERNRLVAAAGHTNLTPE